MGRGQLTFFAESEFLFWENQPPASKFIFRKQCESVRWAEDLMRGFCPYDHRFRRPS